MTAVGESHLQKRSILVALAGLAYVSATAIGVIMRFVLVGVDLGVPFDHLLHAHSHTLYFGWAAIGVLVGALGVLPGLLTSRMRWTSLTLSLSFPLLLIGFLAFGYHPVTIAISTLVMVGWYALVWLYWRATRGARSLSVTLFRASFGYLVVASLGVWALAYLQASGKGTSLGEALAVHAFLLGFAWFLVLGSVGLVVTKADRVGLRFDRQRLMQAVRWWVPLAFFVFPLGVRGGPEIPTLGLVARVAGLLLLYPAWLWVSELWRSSSAARHRLVWRLCAVWFGISAGGLAIVGVFGTSALDMVGRQGIVIYLHTLLLGFVTSILLALLIERVPSRLLVGHNIVLALMLAGLALAVLGEVQLGFRTAAVAAVFLWVTGVAWMLVAVRGMRRRTGGDGGHPSLWHETEGSVSDGWRRRSGVVASEQSQGQRSEHEPEVS